MKIFWWSLCILMGITTITKILSIQQSNTTATEVVITLTLTLFFAWLAHRVKDKSIPQKIQLTTTRNPEPFKNLANTFFSMPIQHSITTLKTMLPAEASQEDIQKKVLKSIDTILEKALLDGVLTHSEEDMITTYLQAFNLTKESLSYYNKNLLQHGALIRDLTEGVVAPRLQITNLPFNFMKSEILVWTFSHLPTFEVKTKKERISKSQRTSICIARGLYWHIGVNKEQQIKKQIIDSLGTSDIAITSCTSYTYQ